MKKVSRISIACFLMGVCFFSACGAKTNHPEIRVAILKDEKDAIIAIRGKYEVVDLKTGKVLLEDRVLRKAKIKPIEKDIYIGRRKFETKNLRIKARKDITIFFKDKSKRYRGAIDVISRKGKITLVNRVDLERYIRGVLYHEVSHRWPMQSMMAQAVAARTYAMYQMQVNKDRDFDVTNDIYSQVYGGRSAERFRTNLAVKKTDGKILIFKGEVLPTYFHANCGGHTEDVSELWNHDLAPLKGRVCIYCKNLPGYHWNKNFQLKDIQHKLNAKGYDLDLIKDIQIIDRTASGRVKKVRVLTRKGKSKVISGKDFRLAVGPNDMKSNKYDVEMKGYFVDFSGKGWGHGVGMCQWGAYQMGKKKFRYEEILEYYYPGAKLVDLEKFNY